MLRLGFTHSTDSRFNASVNIDCSSAGTTTWQWNLLLYPGSTNVPTWTTTVVNALRVP